MDKWCNRLICKKGFKWKNYSHNNCCSLHVLLYFWTRTYYSGAEYLHNTVTSNVVTISGVLLWCNCPSISVLLICLYRKDLTVYVQHISDRRISTYFFQIWSFCLICRDIKPFTKIHVTNSWVLVMLWQKDHFL